MTDAKFIADLERTSLQSELPFAWAVETDKFATVCHGCGMEGGSLKSCGKCKQNRYCCRECQVRQRFPV